MTYKITLKRGKLDVKVFDDWSTVTIANMEPLEVLNKLLEVLSKHKKATIIKTEVKNKGDLIHIYYELPPKSPR